MRPEVPRVLSGVMHALLAEVAPRLGDPYAVQSASSSAMLANYASQEFDRAASRRIEENAAIRALFRRALPVIADEELRKALESAARDEEVRDFRIPALQATNDWLRGLLVRLHEHVETLDGPDAREVEEAIWAELAESTRRRHLEHAL